MMDDMAKLRKIRSKILLATSRETVIACGMDYASLLGMVAGWYYPSDRQLTALLRYFHLEERA
jgi:hypothetical protein